MSRAPSAKRAPRIRRSETAESSVDLKAAKLQVQMLTERIASIIREKPDGARKAALIIQRWLGN